MSDKISVKVLGKHIVIAGSESSSPVSIDGYTLHFGLILMVVLVLAAVGIGAVPRISWLLALAMGVFLLHVVGVALLARGVAWISDASSSENSGRLVFSMFAVFWGVLPVAIGGHLVLPILDTQDFTSNIQEGHASGPASDAILTKALCQRNKASATTADPTLFSCIDEA